jgi:hypothetical protein
LEWLRTSFTTETVQCPRVSGNVIWQELERNETNELGVLGLVNHAHTVGAELLDDAVARNGQTDHWRESYVPETGKSMKARSCGISEGLSVKHLSTLSTSAPAPSCGVDPSVSRRGTCDRVIWTKPLAFAADALVASLYMGFQ